MADSKYPPETISTAQGPEHGRTYKPYVPARQLNTDYPLIDSDPHFSRVLRYARMSDYVAGAAIAVGGPASMVLMERISPTDVSRASFMSVMRLSVATSVMAGFFLYYQRSIYRFYGFSENRREIDRDMREMTDRVKRGEPLYGRSSLNEYMQAVCARQSRYTGVWLSVMPWFNFVNHRHHGVDTAKYYQQAERELETERTG